MGIRFQDMKLVVILLILPLVLAQKPPISGNPNLDWQGGSTGGSSQTGGNIGGSTQTGGSVGGHDQSGGLVGGHDQSGGGNVGGHHQTGKNSAAQSIPPNILLFILFLIFKN